MWDWLKQNATTIAAFTGMALGFGNLAFNVLKEVAERRRREAASRPWAELKVSAEGAREAGAWSVKVRFRNSGRDRVHIQDAEVLEPKDFTIWLNPSKTAPPSPPAKRVAVDWIVVSTSTDDPALSGTEFLLLPGKSPKQSASEALGQRSVVNISMRFKGVVIGSERRPITITAATAVRS